MTEAQIAAPKQSPLDTRQSNSSTMQSVVVVACVVFVLWCPGRSSQ